MRSFRAPMPQVLAFVAAVLGPPVRAAATTTFYPQATLDTSWTDNVLYVSGTPASDWEASVGLDLPLRREGQRGSWGLEYRPTYYRYQEFTFLDRLDHFARLDGRFQSGRRSSLSLRAEWERTQVQGITEALDTPDRFLVQRSDRNSYRGEVAYEIRTSERWRWRAALRGDQTTYTPISGIEETGGGIPEDRTAGAAELAAFRDFSRNSTGGIEYRFERFLLSESGDENDHLLALTTNIGMGRDASIGLRFGVFRRELAPHSPDAEVVSGSDNGLQGGVTVDHRFGRNTLRFEADHGPSAGGGLHGTSTDTTAGMSLLGNRVRRWEWRVSARWARREPTVAGDPALTTGGISANAEWLWADRLGMRIGAQVLNQSGSLDEALNGSFETYWAGLAWYPRGTERPARGTGRPTEEGEP